MVFGGEVWEFLWWFGALPMDTINVNPLGDELSTKCQLNPPFLLLSELLIFLFFTSTALKKTQKVIFVFNTSTFNVQS